MIAKNVVFATGRIDVTILVICGSSPGFMVKRRIAPRTIAAKRKNIVSDVARGKSNVITARLVAKTPRNSQVIITTDVSSGPIMDLPTIAIQTVATSAAMNVG